MKKTRLFLLWVVGLFPWLVLGLFFMSKDVLDAFSATSRALLALYSRNYFAVRWFLGSSKFLVKALPGDNVRFARVRLRHNNRNLSLVLRFVGSFHFSGLLGSWEYFLDWQR